MDSAKRYRYFTFSKAQCSSCIVGFLLWLASESAICDVWKDLLLPDSANAVVVASQIDINRLPTRIWKFHDSVPPEKFLDFYRKKWTSPPKKDSPSFIENTAANWKIISRAEDGYLIAVQVDATKLWESNGMISVVQLEGALINAAQTQKIPDYPKMSGSTVLQELVNHDPGKNALTVVLENRSSSESNRNFYKQYYEQRGWVEIGSQVIGSSNQGILLLQKGPLEASFTFVANDSRTQVVGSIQYPES